MIRGPLPAWLELFLILEQLWVVTPVIRLNLLTNRWWKQVIDARLKCIREGRRHKMKAVAFEAQAKGDIGDLKAINWWQLLFSKQMQLGSLCKPVLVVVITQKYSIDVKQTTQSTWRYNMDLQTDDEWARCTACQQTPNVLKQIPEEEEETFNTNTIFLSEKVLGSWKFTITLPVPCSDGHHQL